MQTTLKSTVPFAGTGLHSGRPVRMSLNPAPADSGVTFRRTDVVGRDPIIVGTWRSAVSAALCTRLVNADGVDVATIEHLMAAIAGTGLTNVRVDIDGPEIPIADGSAAPFVHGILGAGLRRQAALLRAFRVRETVEVREGDAVARLCPADGLELAFEIDFDDAAIGRQTKSLDMANGAFVRELCDSRTFCRARDVEAMRARGLILGGTLDNALVVDGAEVLTPGGLRHADEPVRHKMLDAMGDLALAGAPLVGRYEGVRAGHALTGKLLAALFARPGAVVRVEGDARLAARLPGVGLKAADVPALAA